MRPVAVENFYRQERPEYVLDAAAKVGGIHANNTQPVEFLHENLQIQNHLIYNAWKEKINFWLLAAIFAPGIALGQAIGRWGNYFNQELFGRLACHSF